MCYLYLLCHKGVISTMTNQTGQFRALTGKNSWVAPLNKDRMNSTQSRGSSLSTGPRDMWLSYGSKWQNRSTISTFGLVELLHCLFVWIIMVLLYYKITLSAKRKQINDCTRKRKQKIVIFPVKNTKQTLFSFFFHLKKTVLILFLLFHFEIFTLYKNV